MTGRFISQPSLAKRIHDQQTPKQLRCNECGKKLIFQMLELHDAFNGAAHRGCIRKSSTGNRQGSWVSDGQVSSQDIVEAVQEATLRNQMITMDRRDALRKAARLPGKWLRILMLVLVFPIWLVRYWSMCLSPYSYSLAIWPPWNKKRMPRRALDA